LSLSSTGVAVGALTESVSSLFVFVLVLLLLLLLQVMEWKVSGV
jgi:hypothetical protein